MSFDDMPEELPEEMKVKCMVAEKEDTVRPDPWYKLEEELIELRREAELLQARITQNKQVLVSQEAMLERTIGRIQEKETLLRRVRDGEFE